MSKSALWTSDEAGWELLTPSGFPDEKTLHGLVEEAPQMLPLAGSPDLVVVGREVQLGSGYADIVAIESSGRPVLIEVKLAKNAEARKAIVSQALSYAAYLHGSTSETFGLILASHLKTRGYANLSAAASTLFQVRSFDEAEFVEGLEESLRSGAFRLILVLDEAPEDLVRLVGFLEAISSELSIDLVTVSSYEINGTKVLVPQRVEPERVEREYKAPRSRSNSGKGSESPGHEEFEATIDGAPERNRQLLRRLLAWALDLEGAGLVRLASYQGVGRSTLLPRLKDVGSGLVTIWNDTGSAYLSLWRSALEKRAPHTLLRLEEMLAPVQIRQGSSVPEVTDEILEALKDAYVEAASPADVVIVAAGRAYEMYKEYSAYVCQEGRSFRDGLKRLGFYFNQAIQRELPEIIGRRDGVTFTPEEVERLGAGDALDKGFANLIERLLSDHPERKGERLQVFLLTSNNDPGTLLLPVPIPHSGPAAWVQKQRYVKSDLLELAPKGTEGL